MTDIEWSRRRPKWPYLAAVGCLCVLTVVAPRAWRHSRPEGDDATLSDRSSGGSSSLQAGDAELGNVRFYESPASAMPELAATVPTLPPLAEPSNIPAYAGPMVLADDYGVVDEPLTPVALPTEELTADLENAVPADGFTLRPLSQSVLIRNAAAPKAAAKPLFDVGALVKARDALLAFVEEVKQRQAAQAAAEAAARAKANDLASANPLRVRAESPADRLAMVSPRQNLSEPTPAPTAAPQPFDAVNRIPMQSAPMVAHRPSVGAGPDFSQAAAQPVLRYRPEALLQQLQRLTSVPSASDWAQQVLIRVDSLVAPAADEYDVQPIVRDLAVLAQTGFNDALTVKDGYEQACWLRATRALDRRLPVWGLLADREYLAQPPAAAYPGDRAAMLSALEAVADLTADGAEGAAWREYLRLNDLAGLTSVAGSDLDEQRRATARDVLLRLEDPWLTKEQRQFLAQPAIVTLARQLQPWATGEASVETLAAFIERYEATGSQRDAAAIAELRLRMRWSDDLRLRVLAGELDRHYRNANVRMAITGELMNRLIPPQPTAVAPVRSRIAGADVQGHSETLTQLHVRLLPDEHVWRIGLEARGTVNSKTRSITWPARLRNSSQMDYEARKLVLINRYGMHVWPAEARAEGNTRLLGVESSFSAVPILGAIVESAAREQHRLSRPRAVAQVRDKVRQQACDRMNREADAKLARLEERLREFVLEPIDRFGLAAEPLQMNTTEERAMMRLRLANEQQLGAHTPRPSAPSDSLASFQLHESVFNNALRGLHLDGKRMTAVELRDVLAEKFRRRVQDEPEDIPRAAKVEFAAQDAICVHCHGDRIELILNITELRHGRDSIRGVGVHAFFRPEVDGLDMKLVRDGTLQFSGAHLRTGPRMVLHSVFGKLLPKDQEIPVMMAKLGEDPRFKGLMITQLVIDDGWLAVSMGPERADRVVWRTHGVNRR